ncbi:efflux RND transporter periplasmic adaptor subunit [Solidesulfovibrio carbinolicus]|uniref:Efflux transporter periplasmic adaptor subunit n=1 Tax=Solidesulfovibrio carbinolicus TaxID=296842 RepID=A0A4P6I2N6_9BACT|nr:efflux RND transporter periplasmic adaptor subunit [Solidesulfovibrio carbinolicus]QAZ68099.1 efflux transporter periplasmic adaptor subunit [Solidesulfovibrio carbinolicus]
MTVSIFAKAARATVAMCLPFALAAALSGCATESSGQENAAAPPPPEIVAYAVKQADIPLEMAFMGQTAGSREVEVRARVGGILLRRNFEEGSRVRQGQLMFEIDPAPYQAALEQAKGSLAQAEASLAQAKRDAERMDKLFKGDVVARKDFDDSKTLVETGTAAVDAAKGKVREASLNLEWTKVTAPISGMTSKETRSEGSLVTTGSDGSLLTTMSRVDPIYVNFSMSGQEMMKIRKLRAEGKVVVDGGDFSVGLILPDGSRYPQLGRINFTDTQVDATTGVVKVRAEFSNPDGAVLPGQFVRVRLEGARFKDVLAVPQGAVLNTQMGAMVWTLDDKNQVAPRPVVLGEAVGNDYLVEQGLGAGERIIAEGVIKVRPGLTVRVRGEEPKQAQQPTAAQAAPQQAPKDAPAAAQNGEAAKAEAKENRS